MNRREFLFTWIVPQSKSAMSIEVIEVFPSPEGPTALLVHHANEATRNTFSEWLRANDRKTVLCRNGAGAAIEGRVFRVRMCFGRGLILTGSRLSIREKDILNIV
jgi:hypothetical protein